MVFEDLHWIDSETRALLDSLAESLAATPMCLLMTYRPEYRHAWEGKANYTRISLDPLPPESVDELLDSLLGDDPSLKPLQASPGRNDRAESTLHRGERARAGRDAEPGW